MDLTPGLSGKMSFITHHDFHNDIARQQALVKCRKGLRSSPKNKHPPGTAEKGWATPQGNIAVSVVLIHQKKPAFLTMLAASRQYASRNYRLEMSTEMAERRPDYGKKVCGILLEAATANSVDYAIIGIGINVI